MRGGGGGDGVGGNEAIGRLERVEIMGHNLTNEASIASSKCWTEPSAPVPPEVDWAAVSAFVWLESR